LGVGRLAWCWAKIVRKALSAAINKASMSRVYRVAINPSGKPHFSPGESTMRGEKTLFCCFDATQ
jgi:hypothetical protein